MHLGWIRIEKSPKGLPEASALVLGMEATEAAVVSVARAETVRVVRVVRVVKVVRVMACHHRTKRQGFHNLFSKLSSLCSGIENRSAAAINPAATNNSKAGHRRLHLPMQAIQE